MGQFTIIATLEVPGCQSNKFTILVFDHHTTDIVEHKLFKKCSTTAMTRDVQGLAQVWAPDIEGNANKRIAVDLDGVIELSVQVAQANGEALGGIEVPACLEKVVNRVDRTATVFIDFDTPAYREAFKIAPQQQQFHAGIAQGSSKQRQTKKRTSAMERGVVPKPHSGPNVLLTAFHEGAKRMWPRNMEAIWHLSKSMPAVAERQLDVEVAQASGTSGEAAVPTEAAGADLNAATEGGLTEPPLPVLADVAAEDAAMEQPGGSMQPFFQQKDYDQLGPGA